MRAGSVMYNGKEIPANAKVFKSKSGRECYVSSVEAIHISWKDVKAIAKVKYLDSDEFKEVDFDFINKYII